ncbi:stability/partitioning determinant [Pantoea agglomerans]|uniref:stability/partitioning determinant n=1 Tax=Enterobacter agglomerans TaxID=549 RepID=UPI000DAE5823|nr:stability/partitioning determinant [Pantoea agglomerans]RAH26726.1 stability/partitioning determinant [Pantoea agglomerans]TGX88545.1 stability/partitioning determinant [Pantoea agglomerans]
MVKLKVTSKAAEPAAAPQAVQPEESRQPAQAKGSTARFIRQGDSRPVRRTLPTNFRLPADIIDMLEEEALQTGQNKTTILKAAILAYCTNMDQNEKNRWLLEAPRY